MRLHRVLLGCAAATMSMPVILVGGAAQASFPGTNGDIAWSASCNVANGAGNNINGQQVFSSVNNPASPLTCGNYSPVTAGAADATPYFNSAGTTMYFASNRNGPWAIYAVRYPNGLTPAGGGTFTDGATQLTNLSNSSGYDYSPVVSSGGMPLLAWIRCAGSSSTTCSIYDETLGSNGQPSGPETVVPTKVGVAAPNNVSGDGNRPEINPANSDDLLYVGTDGHIHLMSLSQGPNSDVDLSAASQCAASVCGAGNQSITSGEADEHPDWAPDGQAIVFDSNRVSGLTGQNNRNTTFTLSNLSVANPTVAPVWHGLPNNSSSQIEPVYAPGTTADVTVNPGQGNTGAPPTLAWVSTIRGSNVQTVADGSVANTTNLTNDNQNNDEPIWQPQGPGANAPETPITFLVPIVGGSILGVAGFAVRRRGRRTS